ncbi:HtrA protease/chaperone protein [hydrothermal vent metagenome]|uniref:HtrA protease/chaperone protein n=1 Tax=hydrothermal vent metagenome TaxID=652676 RepID=A0A3B1DJ54_9ZZZZ
MIGINTAIASNSGGNDGIGFSIPSNLILKVMEDMLQFGYVKRAYLGVKLDPEFDADAAKRFHLDRAKGTRVVKVYTNTPAEKAGLQIDDIILSFDGKNVQDENHLINLVSLTPVGSKAKLVVLRKNKKIKVIVLLADRTKREKKRSEIPSPLKNSLRIEPTGLQLHRLNGDLARQMGLRESQQGLLILSVEKRSPLAEKLLSGDVITEIAGKPIRSIAQFQSLLTHHKETKSLFFKIKRSLESGESESRIIIWTR